MDNKQLLYELSTVIPDTHYNENVFNEWIHIGFRLLDIKDGIEEKVSEVVVEDHVGTMPIHLRVEQLGLYIEDKLIPMYKSESPFFTTNENCLPTVDCLDCKYEYVIQNNKLITNFKDGIVIAAYFDYSDNISYNQEVKAALYYYALYRYFQKQSLMGDANAFKQMQHYLQLWGVHKIKCKGNLNAPDLATLENLKHLNTLVQRNHQFQSFFVNLNKPTNVKYT